MRKLPVTRAFSHVIRSTAGNIGFAFHISWPWMLMLLPITIVGNIYLTLNAAQASKDFDPRVLFLMLLMSIPSIIAYSSIAVNWHRYILLDEVAEGWNRLRIDGLMWRYIGNALGIVVIMTLLGFAIGIPLGIVTYFTKGLGWLSTLIYGLGMLGILGVALVSSYRLSVKLPSIALGRTDFRLRDAWDATAGNFWQIIGLTLLFFLCLLLVGLLMLGVSYVLGTSGGIPALSISLAIQVAVNWVATILGVTLLTSLYGFFVEGREF
jgi:hypothetical protein